MKLALTADDAGLQAGEAIEQRRERGLDGRTIDRDFRLPVGVAGEFFGNLNDDAHLPLSTCCCFVSNQPSRYDSELRAAKPASKSSGQD